MREILFSGKRKDNGKWVYGWLGHLHCHNPRANTISSIYFTEITEDHNDKLNVIVDYETVGQYTGLTDKNGKKIFEGDICSCGGMIYQIVWLDDKYGWYCKVLKSNTCLIDTTMAFPLYQYDNRPENGYRQLEVIGNIHDNPELLKGGGEK